MSAINVGDTVQLKSGGPVMTVRFFEEGGDANCDWFDKEKPMNATFPLTSLVIY